VMVQPSARSSHYQPTPQGGGIAVVVAVLVAVWVPFSPALLQN
jgi:UDP-N-acetylmuramyl pentapeptide phosphotransferase/UDP-N-acetylglucosamine-1-phosphate transferase